MSDFISRLAARAVGAPPVAKPRLPAFFPGHDASDEGMEVVHQHIVSRAPPPAQAHAEPAPHEPPFAPIREAELSTPEAPEQRVEVAPPGDSVRVIEHSTTHERELALAVHHVAPPPEVKEEPVAQAAPTVTVQATPVVSELERASAASLPTSAEEAPSVRVHIGRLEVRANLQQAPPQRARRAEPRPQELTLSDYLRGKREAG